MKNNQCGEEIELRRVEGVALTATHMAIARADEPTLIEVERMLNSIESGSRWWWGDYWIAYLEGRAEVLAKADPDMAAEWEAEPRKRLLRLGAELKLRCEMRGFRGTPKDHLAMWLVARFYKSARRRADLSNEAHADAMAGTGWDIEAACGWLAKAEANGWTRAQLRAAMRAEKRSAVAGAEADVMAGADEWDMEFIHGARRWARAHIAAVDDIAPEVATTLLEQLMPLVEVLGKITQKAGKESIFTPAPRR